LPRRNGRDLTPLQEPRPSQSLALDLKATIDPGASTRAHVVSATTTSSCQTYDNTASDTTKGRPHVTTSAGAKKTQTADFYRGHFIFTQKKAKKPITVLSLSEPLACPKAAHAAEAATKKKKRWLRGSGKSKFRTKGKNASATVRGTIWLTQDTCTTTLVHVKRGIVDVFDFAKHKHVLVKAGHTYVAHARK
jgi:hypothetical protein